MTFDASGEQFTFGAEGIPVQAEFVSGAWKGGLFSLSNFDEDVFAEWDYVAVRKFVSAEPAVVKGEVQGLCN